MEKIVVYKESILTIAIGIVCAGNAHSAAELGTYVLGSTGLKGSVVPPPGIYPISLNFVYHSTDLRDENGDRVRQVNGEKFKGRAQAYLNITGLTYVSDLKVFGANYGVRVANTAGVIKSESRIGALHIEEEESGNADLYLEPINLSWHLPRFDLFSSYGVYAPVGDFDDRDDPVLVSDRWSHLFSIGMTAYLDAKRQWALSILPRSELFHRNISQDFKAGANAIVEWGLSRTITFLAEDGKTPRRVLDIGPVGYASWKLTRDESSELPATARYRVYAAGAEIGITETRCHSAKFSLRYEREFFAHSRPQGNVGLVRFSIKF